MSREAFEKWARDNGIRYQSKYSTGEYYFGDADLAWKAWQAAQAQAKPIAAVHGWFHGECVIRALDPEAALPAGMALYSQPQSQAVNQQLLEALLEHFVGARFAIDTGMKGTALNCINAGIDAIAAAQEVGNE